MIKNLAILYSLYNSLRFSDTASHLIVQTKAEFTLHVCYALHRSVTLKFGWANEGENSGENSVFNNRDNRN